ncbi:Cuticle protein AMP3 [Penaeus vannamei]|uniref:Cuticle protein AMP3 n=1 Tax=Penaeus vannamei TaxID=6689 RepID=A0A3R7M5A3_PENVA|nr:cuticle protein AMP1B-like [Penaeus vannamei]ROT72354.1 Cuticle protein AMP3 [Penaeus vannamei]
MHLILLVCLAGLVAASPMPQNRHPEYDAQILVDEREDRGDGNFRYRFETSNGINTEKVGTPGSQGQSNMQGAFSFPLPEGGVAQFTYVADEFGYQPSSDLLPQPPPLPAHVYRLLEIAEQQRAQGITFEKK